MKIKEEIKEDIKEEGQVECKCVHCQKREEEEKEMEDLNFAILIALVPALTITLFSTMHLF